MSTVSSSGSRDLSILLVSAQYLPHMGGVENYTAHLAAELTRLGHHVTVACCCPAAGPEPTARPKVLRFPAIGLMGGRYPLLRRNREFRRLAHALDAEHFDAVVINTRFYPLSVWGARFARRHGITPLVIEHGSAPLIMGGPLVSAGVRLVERFVTSLLMRYRPAFAGVSEAAAEWLVHFGISTKDVVYNCVDYDAIDACPAAVLDDPPGTVKLLYAGRLLEQKGILPLLEAVQNLRRAFPVTLYVAGEGPLRGAVEAAGEQVRYLGLLRFEQVIAAIRATDIFCFPSIHPEGFPTSVLEAAACGACAVSTVQGGTEEILPDDSLAYRLADAEPETIERALREAITHPDEAREKGARLKSYVRERFNWQRTAESLTALCRRINNT